MNISIKREAKERLFEEVVADGDPDHNPYAKQWEYENKILEDKLTERGKYMISMENGKVYLCIRDDMLTEALGVPYYLCTLIKSGKQYGMIYVKPASVFRPYNAYNAQSVYYDYRGR
jgi:hypothetical protein